MGHTQLKEIVHRVVYWSYVHLMISFSSFIILSCWGLGLSPLTIVGNILFSPLLYLFLLITTGIFFAELLGIPNMLLIQCLELLNNLWLWCMQLAQPYFCTIICAKPPVWQICIIITATCALILTQTAPIKKLGMLVVLIFYSCYYVFIQPINDRVITIPCNQGEITVIQQAQTVWLIDPGYIGRTSGAQAFIEHSLLPTIARELGTNNIDYALFLQPGVYLFKALVPCLQRMHIKHLYIPYWQGEQPGLKRAFMLLKKAAAEHTINLQRSVKETLICTSSAQGSLRINQDPMPFQKGPLQIAHIWVSGKVDNNNITIYPAQYTKQIKNRLQPKVSTRNEEQDSSSLCCCK